MPDAQRSCETCLFWRRQTTELSDGESYEGECRRRSPLPYLEDHTALNGDVVPYRYAFWPTTAESDWCGEWQPKATPQARDCQECERLRETVKGLADRVAAQSEMLSRKAEKSPVHP